MIDELYNTRTAGLFREGARKSGERENLNLLLTNFLCSFIFFIGRKKEIHELTKTTLGEKKN